MALNIQNYMRPTPTTPDQPKRSHQNAERFLNAVAGAVGAAGAIAGPVVQDGISRFPGGAGLMNGPVGQLLSGIGGGAGGGLGGATDSSNTQMQLLQLQEQMQLRAQVFQTMSNISKAEHESKMNTIRSIRP